MVIQAGKFYKVRNSSEGVVAVYITKVYDHDRSKFVGDLLCTNGDIPTQLYYSNGVYDGFWPRDGRDLVEEIEVEHRGGLIKVRSNDPNIAQAIGEYLFNKYIQEQQKQQEKEGGDVTSDETADVPTATKHDNGKPRMELLSSEALQELAKVMTFGANKYGDQNWRKGMAWSRYYGAALRHIFASLDGKDKDDESGLDHLAHAMACLMILLEYKSKELGADDRHKAV